MNILMIVTWYTPKGAPAVRDGVFHYEQSMELQRQGCNVALYFPFDSQEKQFSAEVEWGLKTYRTGVCGNRTLQIIRDFKKIRDEFKPDLIHAHVAAGAGFVALGLSKIYGIPYMVTEHTPVEIYGLDNPKTRFRAGAAYHFSKKNLCVSNACKATMESVFPKEHFELMYNATQNPDNLEMDSQKYAVDGKINFSIVAIFVNEFQKGFQFLIPAIRELKNKNYPIMLHVVGGGTYLEKYQQMAKELGVEDCCIFYGNCPKQKVYSIMSQMDFSVSASIFETAGVSVQEAMLLGKPVMVTRCGGPETLVTEDSAIVVDKGSTEELVKGISAMIHSYKNIDSEKIKAYAFENFEIGQVTERYLRLYRSILER